MSVASVIDRLPTLIYHWNSHFNIVLNTQSPKAAAWLSKIDLFLSICKRAENIKITNWNFLLKSWKFFSFRHVFKVQYVENDKIWAINFDIKPWIYLSFFGLGLFHCGMARWCQKNEKPQLSASREEPPQWKLM